MTAEVDKIKRLIGWIDKKIDLKKFMKFGMTGLLNTAVDFAVYSFCLEILGFDIKLAQPAGQCAAIANSYLINKNWTFEKRENYNISEMLKFLLINGGSVGINILSAYIFHDILGVNEYVCKIPTAFITIMINYFGNKFFVFK